MYPRDHPASEGVAPSAKTPLRAFRRAVINVVGAVLLVTALWAWRFNDLFRIEIIRRSIDPDMSAINRILPAFWGTHEIWSPLLDTVVFAVTRLTSPAIWGPLAVCGVLAVAVEYHRRHRESVWTG
ncbi:hypothetical protein [Halomicrobium salinisoli]|uniref:hypothetical protein n=1 Tax=Halomicrobium salinisoli TaxID=2878391 RepID=UPI001CEFBC38|nr:hypothetical protein [Halomicrobium salinisoli]